MNKNPNRDEGRKEESMKKTMKTWTRRVITISKKPIMQTWCQHVVHGSLLVLSLTGAMIRAEDLSGGIPLKKDPNMVTSNPPPNVSLSVGVSVKQLLTLEYDGKTLFNGTLYVVASGQEPQSLREAGIALVPPSEKFQGLGPAVVVSNEWTKGERENIEQHITFRLVGDDKRNLVLRGMVRGSDEAFPSETRGPAQKRFPCVRNAVGVSRNLRNNSIYDRKRDWVLEAPTNATTRISPMAGGEEGRTFQWETVGTEVLLVFRPRFYQKHKNIRHFEPWTYRPRQDSIAGWCSWWAYRANFNEKDLHELLSVWKEKKLGDFGYRFIQIDDGFEKGNLLPDDGNWLDWNAKFPSGIQGYAKAVKSAGLEPGFWVFALFKNFKDTVSLHPDWFVCDSNGKPVEYSSYRLYGANANNPRALDELVRPLYRELKRLGFTYVKIDSSRHYLYDVIYEVAANCADGGTPGAAIFRNNMRAIREELGPDAFILCCWGVLPEAAGLANGCRLGGDGFSAPSLQQYNSWNGIVWRNDPDHCDILPGGDVRDTVLRPLLVSLAGGILMLSDKAAVYRSDAHLEGVKRAGPVLPTVPGQLYDYDPTKTDALIAANRATPSDPTVRQKDRRYWKKSPIDAGGNSVCPWWMLEIERPFEYWSVLAYLNFDNARVKDQEVRFADIGLASEKDYLVFEFWSRRFVGVCRGSFLTGGVAAKAAAVFAIRELLDRPQVLSSSRHFSQGGVDLEDVTWDARQQVLAGRSQVIEKDPYRLTIHVPTGWKTVSATFDDHDASLEAVAPLMHLTLTPKTTGTVRWEIRFQK